jgi:cytochrome c oxidase subunit III
MRSETALDVRDLPTTPHGPNVPIWWGIIGLIVVEIVVFASLVSSYFYLKVHAAEWPPGGVKKPELLLPTINAFVLILSSGPMYWGEKAIREGRQKPLKFGLIGSIFLALLFLGLKVYEYRDTEYFWYSHAYGSVIWAITGFHSAHVLALVLKTIVIAVLAWRGYFTKEYHVPVEVNGFYWHFVVLIWIPLYATMYLSPYLMGRV